MFDFVYYKNTKPELLSKSEYHNDVVYSEDGCEKN